ncbi:hypothetical protein F511_45752 [Dorcoceras hygrometricum]|uniref:Uncharacterized protein n=1 Tax=Dorcoceras hygrometricum TaxID=472368 RepID=A0A2Z6ZV61_9LAMI|nr:hypothetical protein F511_45752 [Dorcoceras hygrometricum]
MELCAKEEATSCCRSADGLALMTSSVTSSYSADGLRDQSQESAGSLHPDARGSDVVEEISSRKLLFTSRCYLKKAIAKRCRLHNRKLQWIQSQRKDFQSQCLCIQTQEDKSIIVEEDSGEAIDEPDASNSSIQSKSLYESAVATHPVVGKSSRELQHPVNIFEREEVVSNGINFYRGFIYKGCAIEVAFEKLVTVKI